ncbi:hypothetical protein HG535_0D05890 [Zygotorulaspora mrakii]|uniref:DNA-directed RNA polymerase n=1 Tax=Zygotorulaspora mrakii TaxID=42260 RepID=A0A7H9B2M9_ZYGMR|nr:uncharacterized protein HG535_0D05890 [Zygotorulaspora mrakii]QLG72880.1 hypothetical protein HG535_0D05890 [Zygotorulaspora mrakii]
MLRPLTRHIWSSTLIQTRSISSKGSKLHKPAAEVLRSRPLPTDSIAVGAHHNLGFLESSQVTTSPSFDPFDMSHASTLRATTQSRDVMQLWSLLEACLCSKYLNRAFSILQSLYMIRSHRPYFIDDYNMYLSSLVEKGSIKAIEELDSILAEHLEKKFPDIEYNDKTLAIMIHNALKFDSENPSTIKSLRTYLKMNMNGVKKIMSNLDVLTFSDFKILYWRLNLIRVSDMPETVKIIVEKQPITTNSKNDVEIDEQHHKDASSSHISNEDSVAHDIAHENLDNASRNNLSTTPESITQVSLDAVSDSLEKDAEKLKAVDTLGMRVVRHTLLGLSLNEHQRKQIAKFHFDAEKNLLNVDQNKSIDFFEIFRSLKSDTERTAFESSLDEFNQDRQRALENRATDAARERWKHDFEEARARGDLSIEKKLNVKLWKWYNSMLPLVKEEVKQCNEAMSGTMPKSKDLSTQEFKQHKARLEYGPYLSLVDPGKMCVITILELLKLNSTGGVIEGMRTARAVIAVGKAIEMEFRSEQLLKSESQVFKDVNRKSHQFKKYVQRAKSSFRSIKIEESKIVWPQSARAKIGSIMISMLIHVGKVNIEGTDPFTKEKVYGEAPAFSHGYQYHNGSKLGVLKIHRSLIHQLNGERLVASVQPQLLPMLVKPRQWKNWKSGGYFYTQSTLVRSKDSPEQIAYLKAVSDAKAIDVVYDGLNVLGETAWTINRNIFNVMSEVWNKGELFLEIPGIQEELNLLPPPPRDADPSIHREWKLKNKELANKFSSNRSVRCDSNYKLEIARAYLGEKFYFPHNLDFRGRAYPLSPHFNHLGNDMSRGLLIFWKGKRLGPQGLKWLKVHLSNLFGFDKASLTERIAFTDRHMKDIKECAISPLGPNRWWMQAEKPWQTLATCMELTEAYKLENPEDFISHQPVHQDGTCNGLQHYAALGGDIEGAAQVNLVPNDVPQDVYSHVAKLVASRLEVAAKKGDEYAKILQDKITRKVVKQTVMTNVYGVTYVGATFQIDKQLSHIFEDRKYSLELSKYLTKHVFAAVRELFQGAHLIQDWLGECAKRVSKSIRLDVDEKSFKNGNKPDFMSSVIWTTPLGLPIVQPYRELSKKQVTTNLQTVFISDPFSVNPINARRQKAGFPPNFIHSLDASHMLLSATECGKHGLDFASVHDSYWTHGCDVDQMNICLREQFIKLHEVDLIERLKNEFDERYKNYVQIARIDKHSELAKKILIVRNKLSESLGRPATLADEIYMEKERVRLMRSTHYDEVERGRQMVSTVSLVEEQEGHEELESKRADMSTMVILVPLKLPSIPPKGEFDVRELRNSKYFFS